MNTQVVVNNDNFTVRLQNYLIYRNSKEKAFMNAGGEFEGKKLSAEVKGWKELSIDREENQRRVTYKKKKNHWKLYEKLP